MAKDIFLIVIAVIIPVLTLVFSLYILVYYQHPDDHYSSYFSKTVVVLGLCLAILTVLLLPLDIANQGGDLFCNLESSSNANSGAVIPNDLCGGLNLTYIWQSVYLIIAGFIVIIVPFAMFFYEHDDLDLNMMSRYYKHKNNAIGRDPKSSRTINSSKNDLPRTGVCYRLLWSCCYSFCTICIIVIIFLVAFFFLNKVELEVETFEAESFSDLVLDQVSDIPTNMILEVSSSDTLKFDINVLLYVIAFMSLLGWIVLSFSLGIGFVSLPVDLYYKFKYRPVRLTKHEYVLAKQALYKRLEHLLTVLQKIKNNETLTEEDHIHRRNAKTSRMGRFFSSNPSDKLLTLKELKKEVSVLEDDLADLDLCHENWKNYNPLVPYMKIVLGIISFCLSFIWILQIVIYNLSDVHPFLNNLIITTMKDIKFGIVGVIFFCIFSLYLLFCAVNGIEKVSSRFLFLPIEIHPLKVGGTYMSSLLFNVMIILICTCGLVQFLETSFSKLMINTDIQFIFEGVVERMVFFSFVFSKHIFEYIVLGMVLLTVLFNIFCYNDRAKEVHDLEERIDKQLRFNMNSHKANSVVKDGKANEAEPAVTTG